MIWDEYAIQENRAKLFFTKLVDFSRELSNWLNKDINYLMITLEFINNLRKYLKSIGDDLSKILRQINAEIHQEGD